MVLQNSKIADFSFTLADLGQARDKAGGGTATTSQACFQSGYLPHPLGKLKGAETKPKSLFASLNDLGECAQNDRKDFLDQVIRSAIPLLRSRIRRSFQDSDAIEDVLGDTLLAIAQGISQFRGQAKLTTWLYSIAHHKICDHIERVCRYRRLQEEAAQYFESERDPESGEAPNAWDLNPEKLLQRKRVLELTHEAIRDLPADQAEAWKLREQENLSSEAVAARLGESEVTVRVRLHRARKRVIEQVQGEMSFLNSSTYIKPHGL